MRFYCSGCGGSRTVVDHETLDPRYPVVYCEDCKKRGPGVREDTWDREKWQAAQTAANIQKAAAKARRK